MLRTLKMAIIAEDEGFLPWEKQHYFKDIEEEVHNFLFQSN